MKPDDYKWPSQPKTDGWSGPKQEVVFANALVVKKAQSGTFFIYHNGEYVALAPSKEAVVRWLWANWPVGTKVKWMVTPW